MQSHAAPVLEGDPWMARPRCERCGRTEHIIDGDGPTVCRVCLFAWGHYSAVILRGHVVREAGGAPLRHASHEHPISGCALCRADVRPPPSFDGWLRGRNT